MSSAAVHVEACDIRDATQLGALFRSKVVELPPLRGIVHAAMVLDDGMLDDLEQERFESVIDVKLRGALNLHNASLDLPLDMFVCFGSATTLVGNPGQANYVAANAAVEALVRGRRRQGLPATLVAWGPISDAGVLTRNTQARDALKARFGARGISAADALRALDGVLAADESPLAIADFDWHNFSRLLPRIDGTRFETLARHLGAARGEEADVDLVELFLHARRLQGDQCQISVTQDDLFHLQDRRRQESYCLYLRLLEGRLAAWVKVVL